MIAEWWQRTTGIWGAPEGTRAWGPPVWSGVHLDAWLEAGPQTGGDHFIPWPIDDRWLA